jgi:fucose 4-O-acetylase-like acetyltransferase
MLRAVSICVVVFGHWTIWAVTADDDGIGTVNLLSVAPWAPPFTWVFQVMPVFFLVGGYANAASLAARRRKGGTVAGWVRQRALRLLRPSAVLLAVLLAVRVVAVALGADEELVRDATWAATAPLWFLVVYLAVVALAPLAAAAHRRWGLRAAVALAVGVLIGDVLRIASGNAGPAAANYLLAWLAVHQLGVAWHAGDLPRTPSAAWAWVGTGLAVGLLLAGPGPYGVPMVGAAPAPDLTNTAPPTIALLALATAQTGVVLLLRRRASAWLARPRAWTAVVALNGRILTVFLWHMAALVMVGVSLVGTGFFPTPPVGSAPWFALRIPWLVVLAVVLAALVALFGRWETPQRADPQERESPAAVALGVVAVFAGLASLGVTDTRGLAPPVAGIPVIEVAVIAGGLLLLKSGGRRRQRDHEEAQQ